jgi:hypothetical protein
MAPGLSRLLNLTLVLAASIALGCGPALPEYTLVPAASGAAIKLERKSEVRLADGSRALRLDYRSDLDIGDANQLSAEIEEVWRTFQPEAERLGVATVLIEARALRGERWSRIGRARRFAYRRDREGSWKLVERQIARTTAVKPL